MNKRKFTVIIPTRERADTLKYALRTVTNQNYANLEIIVSDNFSCDETESITKNENDKRVRYINTGKRVSMSENWEFALKHVTGDWLTIIGDDDGLLPNCFEKVNKILDKVKDVQAIRSSTCGYTWPGMNGNEFGRLHVPMGEGWEVRDSLVWFRKVLSGEQSYTTLPMLYNGGFIKMSAINNAKGGAADFYKSFIPDVYSSVVLSQVIDKYIYSHEPFAVNGASKHSTGTSHFNRDVSLKEAEDPKKKFTSESNIPSHRFIPKCTDGSFPVSIQVMILESYLQASEVHNRLCELNYSDQLKVILATSGGHKEEVYAWGKVFAKENKLNYEKIVVSASRYRYRLKLKSFIYNIKRKMTTFCIGSKTYPVNNVLQAVFAADLIRIMRMSVLVKMFVKNEV